jgi:hypothetical protein
MTVVQRSGMGLFAVLAAGGLVGSAMAAPVLKQEPAMGKLSLGQKVLVDDGSCPAGQIKEVTGGDHVKAGGKQHIVRTYKCIPH